MYSGKGLVWHYMGRYAESFFPSYDHYIQPCRTNVDVLYKAPAKHEIRDNFFTVRVVRAWNDLPEKVKEAKSVNAFKTALDNWIKNNHNQ